VGLEYGGVIKGMFLRSAIWVLFLPVWCALPNTSQSLAALSVREIRVPNGGIQPEALADGANIHLLYYSGDPAHGDLYYVRSSDKGETWSPPLRVNSEPGSAIALGTIRGGKMALGRNGRIYVVWNGSSKTESNGPINPETRRPGMPFLYTRLNDSHTAFEPQQNLMRRTFGLDGGGTIAADTTGNVYVAWHGKSSGATAGEAGRQLWIAKSSDDGRRFSAEHPATDNPTGACGCCGTAMYADSKGDVYVLYRSAKQNVHRDIYLLSSSDRGKTFVDQDLHPWNINACPMSSMAFAEGGRAVEAAWETGGQVYFQNLSDLAAKPSSATSPNGGHKHPRLAIDSEGKTLLVWTEGTGWGRGGSVAWQVYDSAGRPVTKEHGVVPHLPAWSFGTAVATGGEFLIIY
jgi:hypothetical protein